MGTPIDRDKLLSIGYMAGGRSKSKRVKEYRSKEDGHRIKETIDEHNNSTIEHATKDDRVDVELRPKVTVLRSEVQ